MLFIKRPEMLTLTDAIFLSSTVCMRSTLFITEVAMLLVGGSMDVEPPQPDNNVNDDMTWYSECRPESSMFKLDRFNSLLTGMQDLEENRVSFHSIGSEDTQACII